MIEMPALTTLEFRNFMKHEISLMLPGSHIVEVDEENLDIDYGESKMSVFLGNIYKIFSKNQDLEAVTNFLEAQLAVLNAKKELSSPLSESKSSLFPAIRSINMVQNIEKKGKMVFEQVAEDLVKVYVKDHPLFVSFITKEQCDDTLSEKQMQCVSEENLNARDWVDAVDTMELGNGDKILIYSNIEPFYQAQFLTTRAKEKLGDQFLIAFPSTELTFVFLSARGVVSMQAVLALKQITMEAMRKEAHRTSSSVYTLQNQKLTKIM